MERILAASDLSTRSRRALRRAIALAGQYRAELCILYAADDEYPPDLVAEEERRAGEILSREAELLGAGALPSPPSIATVAGDPFKAIADEAARRDVGLIVMGAHRKRLLGDIFTGTTVERVIRTGGRPVLMVNGDSDRPYRTVLAAVDAAEESMDALRVAASLGFFAGGKPLLVHGCMPIEEGLMVHASVERERIEEEVSNRLARVRSGLVAMLQRAGLGEFAGRLLVEKAAPYEAIEQAAASQGADLVIVGTRGRSGVAKLLLGSVTDRVLRQLDLDILAIPPARAAESVR